MRATAVLALGVALIAAPVCAQTVYPSDDHVPANLLRLSIVFPEPPAAGTTPRIWLASAAGTEIAGAFYPQRLWSPDGRTLTIYLDPGRVKTGLILRAQRGPVLDPGESVQLRMGDRVLKTWTAEAAVDHIGAPRFDDVRPPKPGSREPLRLSFSSPIDWQARDLVAIEAPDHTRLTGHAGLIDGERVWRFTPDRPWAAGRHAIRLNSDLEDPEGNRLNRPFEVHKDQAATTPLQDEQRAFEVR